MNLDLKVGTGSTPSTLISNGLYIGGRRGRRPYSVMDWFKVPTRAQMRKATTHEPVVSQEVRGKRQVRYWLDEAPVCLP